MVSSTRNPFYALEELETERLVLRRLRRADAADLFAYASDPQVAQYVLWEAHRLLEDSLGFLDSVLESYREGAVAPWGVEHKAERHLIGTCGFVDWSPQHARAEIGYAMARRFWGQGLMTEAVQAVVDYGFGRMGLDRVQAMCEPDNVASARVMEKVGMTYEGTLRGYMIAKGVSRDLQVYAILRDEWQQKANRPGPGGRAPATWSVRSQTAGSAY